jgi:single-stranded-DNA-specific exonuclease
MTEVLGRIVPILGASRSHEGGNLGCELLLSTESDDAEEIHASLSMEWERKRERGRRALDRVMSHISELDLETPKVIVLVMEHLPSKTVGFCAARLTDSFHKPVVIVSTKGEIGVGEARAPKGADLVEALTAHKEYFIGYGGHKQAAGFSIERSKIEDFKRSFIDYMEAKIDPAVIRKEIVIDDRIAPEDVTPGTLQSLLCLEPFGEENRKPIFLLESLQGSVLKKIDGTLKLNEVALSGEGFANQFAWEAGDKVNLVVSPFGDGSVRIMDVIDWKKTK